MKTWHQRSTNKNGRGTKRSTSARNSIFFGKKMVGRAGLEPATLSLKGARPSVIPVMFKWYPLCGNRLIRCHGIGLTVKVADQSIYGFAPTFRQSTQLCGTSVAPDSFRSTRSHK